MVIAIAIKFGVVDKAQKSVEDEDGGGGSGDRIDDDEVDHVGPLMQIPFALRITIEIVLLLS